MNGCTAVQYGPVRSSAGKSRRELLMQLCAEGRKVLGKQASASPVARRRAEFVLRWLTEIGCRCCCLRVRNDVPRLPAKTLNRTRTRMGLIEDENECEKARETEYRCSWGKYGPQKATKSTACRDCHGRKDQNANLRTCVQRQLEAVPFWDAGPRPTSQLE